MLNLKGTHGTTWTRAHSILDEGYRVSKGRAGTGVYFWCDSPFSNELAIAWWKAACEKGRYACDDETQCAVLISSINIKINEFLDLEDKKIKKGLAQLAKDRGVRVFDKKVIAATRSLFISRVEKKLNVKFKVIETSVSLPSKQHCAFYPLQLLGSPHCYLVLKTDCITIEKASYIAD